MPSASKGILGLVNNVNRQYRPHPLAPIGLAPAAPPVANALPAQAAPQALAATAAAQPPGLGFEPRMRGHGRPDDHMRGYERDDFRGRGHAFGRDDYGPPTGEAWFAGMNTPSVTDMEHRRDGGGRRHDRFGGFGSGMVDPSMASNPGQAARMQAGLDRSAIRGAPIRDINLQNMRSRMGGGMGGNPTGK